MGFDISAKDALNLSAMLTPTFMAHTMPGSGYYNALQSQLGSAQSGLQALAAKEMAKKQKKKTPWGKIVGTALPIIAAPFTGGASLALLPATMSAGSAIDAGMAGDWGSAATNLAGAGVGAYGMKSGGSPDVSSMTPTLTAPPGPGQPGFDPYKFKAPWESVPTPATEGLQLKDTLAGQTMPGGGAFQPSGGLGGAFTGGGSPTGGALNLSGAGEGGAFDAASFMKAASTDPSSYMPPGSGGGGAMGPSPTMAVRGPSQSPGEGDLGKLWSFSVEQAAQMKPQQIRELWDKNPTGGILMMKQLDQQGVTMSNRQLRAIPLKYRRELKKQGMNIPQMFMRNTASELQRVMSFMSGQQNVMGMSPYSQIIPGPDGREYYQPG